jgi:hypothetical protein
MDKDYLLLKRAAVSRPSGQWNDGDFDVLANGEIVGRIYKANAAPVRASWMWTLVSGTTTVAARRTGMLRRARPPWRRSLRVGGGNDFKSTRRGARPLH